MRMLETKKVSVRFGGVQALSAVDIAVGEWEVVGILGPNGAGKTTLFNCVSGFVEPNNGRVLIRGHDVTHMRPDERVRLGLGRTFQHGGLVRSFTVLENLVAAQHTLTGYGDLSGLLGTSSSFHQERRVRARALRALEFMGIEDLATEDLGSLPYGILKIVEVATTLAVNPEVVILDEPFAGMGAEEARHFGDRMLEMRTELGLSVVVIDHHAPEVLRISDHVYVLNFGQMLAEGDPAEVREHPAVLEAYMGGG
jgi:branched-chain amino acid transport system ATP-binding protein